MTRSRLGLRKTNDFAFCGSSLAMNLPVPCRPAEKMFDFGVRNKLASAGPSIPTAGNVDDWACKGTQTSAGPSYVPESVQSLAESTWSSSTVGSALTSFFSSRMFTSRTTKDGMKPDRTGSVDNVAPGQRMARANDLNSTESSKFFSIQSTREFTMEIYPVYETKPSDSCTSRIAPSTCYAACCDSAYKTSYFCQTEGTRCF